VCPDFLASQKRQDPHPTPTLRRLSLAHRFCRDREDDVDVHQDRLLSLPFILVTRVAITRVRVVELAFCLEEYPSSNFLLPESCITRFSMLAEFPIT
jgi:hypothetical protein